MDIQMINEVKATIKEQAARITEEKDKQDLNSLDRYRLDKVEMYLNLAVTEAVNILLFPQPNL